MLLKALNMRIDIGVIDARSKVAAEAATAHVLGRPECMHRISN